MAKKIIWANVHVPQYPRVRFFQPKPGVNPPFDDITQRVSKLIVETDDPNGPCALLRYDDKEQLVWKTVHPSLQETKWHVEFEYGLPEEKWIPYNGS